MWGNRNDNVMVRTGSRNVNNRIFNGMGMDNVENVL